MIARILCISDLHKRYKEGSSVKNNIEVQKLIQEDIIAFNIEHAVTHNIILGDWYDRGFHGLGPAYSEIEMDRRISASVNGEVYLCVGNHFYLERDENPEMYIIQPNEYFRPSFKINVPDKPIFKVVPQLCFGPVQIDFFHYSKVNKIYYQECKPETTFHIGIYHDDKVIPSHIRELEGYSGDTSFSYLYDTYKNIDLAIHGHIHCKVGVTALEIAEGHKVPLVIPGALGITQNKDIFKNSEIKLPMIEIDDNYNVQLKMVPFSTHIDRLKFYDNKRQQTNLTELMEKNSNGLIIDHDAIRSLPTFMRSKGYSDVHLKILDVARNADMTITDVLRILQEAKDGQSQL